MERQARASFRGNLQIDKDVMFVLDVLTDRGQFCEYEYLASNKCLDTSRRIYVIKSISPKLLSVLLYVLSMERSLSSHLVGNIFLCVIGAKSEKY